MEKNVFVDGKLALHYHKPCNSPVWVFSRRIKDGQQNDDDEDAVSVYFFYCGECAGLGACLPNEGELGVRVFSKKWFDNPTKRLPKMKG